VATVPSANDHRLFRDGASNAMASVRTATPLPAVSTK
jgi:hypothetical protein